MADILLVDMQSFYASVEKAEAPHLKNRPVIVSGDPERRKGRACGLSARQTIRRKKRRTAVGSAGQMPRRRYRPSADAAVY